jgi:hypothetical protein
VGAIDTNWPVPGTPEEVRQTHIPNLTTSFASVGYQLATQSNELFTYQNRHTPAWAIVLAIILFPIGLFFLFAKEDRAVTLSLAPGEEGVLVALGGNASGDLKRIAANVERQQWDTYRAHKTA